jgi:hypothetical protein
MLLVDMVWTPFVCVALPKASAGPRRNCSIRLGDAAPASEHAPDTRGAPASQGVERIGETTAA